MKYLMFITGAGIYAGILKMEPELIALMAVGALVACIIHVIFKKK